MTLDQASKIIDIYGQHMEFYGGKLMILFSGRIPESLLPFSKKVIEEASNILAKHHHNSGNQSFVDAINACKAGLIGYTDDEEALSLAIDRFSSESWRKVNLPNLKKIQKTQEL